VKRAPRFDRDQRPPEEDPKASLVSHAVPAAELARATASIALQAESALFVDRRRPESLIAAALKRHRAFSLVDRLFVSRSIDSLFRWWGWIEPLRLDPIEARLLVAVLLDRSDVPEACRAWARQIGVDPRCLSPIGNAPSWARRAEAFRRLVEQPRAATEPWALFPRWLRDELLEPPGTQPLKHRVADLLLTLQQPSPNWVRVFKGQPEAIWNELRGAGCPPRVHPHHPDAATLDPGTILQMLGPFRRGDLVSQDLSSLAVIAACDADPGERWWYAGKPRGERAILLADRMSGKGTLIVAELDARNRARTARIAQKGPYSNVATRIWDGRHVVGKPGTYHGVLLEPPSSCLGLWRRDPTLRWLTDRAHLDRLVEQQAGLLRAVAAGIRPAGVLIYAVPSLVRSETTAQVERFLSEQPDFQLEPFPDPIDGTPTDGTFALWPGRADTEAWFVARFIRSPRPRHREIAPSTPED
jgi:16S rRNA (cytosine967-C5)-methyltransferase